MAACTLAESMKGLKNLDICDLQGSRVNREEESGVDMERTGIDRGTNVSY